jgi:hypothetical protein
MALKLTRVAAVGVLSFSKRYQNHFKGLFYHTQKLKVRKFDPVLRWNDFKVLLVEETTNCLFSFLIASIHEK